MYPGIDGLHSVYPGIDGLHGDWMSGKLECFPEWDEAIYSVLP